MLTLNLKPETFSQLETVAFFRKRTSRNGRRGRRMSKQECLSTQYSSIIPGSVCGIVVFFSLPSFCVSSRLVSSRIMHACIHAYTAPDQDQILRVSDYVVGFGFDLNPGVPLGVQLELMEEAVVRNELAVTVSSEHHLFFCRRHVYVPISIPAWCPPRSLAEPSYNGTGGLLHSKANGSSKQAPLSSP